MNLCKKITDILEAADMRAYNPQKHRGEYYVEIEFYSPAGEDVIETVWFDGTNKGFVKAFRKNAEDFDPDDHAELWIDGRGKNGIPDSVRALIDDADAIKTKLLEVADDLESLKI